MQALNNDPNFSALFSAHIDPGSSDGSGKVSLAATATTAGGSGIQFDKSSGLQITNGDKTYTIDTSADNTVEDLLNSITGSGAGLLAQINAAGTGISIQSRLSGGDFSIGENGGSAATQLGIRTFHNAEPTGGPEPRIGSSHPLHSKMLTGTIFRFNCKTARRLNSV